MELGQIYSNKELWELTHTIEPGNVLGDYYGFFKEAQRLILEDELQASVNGEYKIQVTPDLRIY